MAQSMCGFRLDLGFRRVKLIWSMEFDFRIIYPNREAFTREDDEVNREFNPCNAKIPGSIWRIRMPPFK